MQYISTRVQKVISSAACITCCSICRLSRGWNGWTSPSLDIPLQWPPLLSSFLTAVVLASARSLKEPFIWINSFDRAKYRYYCRAHAFYAPGIPSYRLHRFHSHPLHCISILVFNVHGSLMKPRKVMMLVAASQHEAIVSSKATTSTRQPSCPLT